MTRIATLLLTALIAAGLPAAGAAQARHGQSQGMGDSLGSGWGQQQDQARDDVRRGRIMPLSQVIDIIRRQFPGRPLDAGLEQRGANAVYRVRWITDGGQRRDFIVDASTGRILTG